MQLTAKLKPAASGTGMRMSLGTADKITFTYTLTPGNGGGGGGSTGSSMAASLSSTARAIVVSAFPNTLFQIGNNTDAYWYASNEWGAGTLVRGTYNGISGSTYEQYVGGLTTATSSGGVSARFSWKWPLGTTEVKAYPSLISGKKPGYAAANNMPGGYPLILQNGTTATSAPSGPTPGTFMPIQLLSAIPQLHAQIFYQHNISASGQGHLTFDIWTQSGAAQSSSFPNGDPLKHELMIPLNYWGNYGGYPTGRDWANWSASSTVINGITWQIWHQDFGAPGSYFNWGFTAFEPMSSSIGSGIKLDLAAFINYCRTKGWIGTAHYLTSIELGIEPVSGVGDIQIIDYKVGTNF